MRKGIEPKTIKEKATKKSTTLAPNMRKSDDQKQKEKIEKDKQQYKQMTKKIPNKNTSQSVDRNNSLPRIKNSMSNENISPPKVKKSKSSQGIMSPNKKRSSNKINNGSVRKSRQKQVPEITEQSPMFSIGSPGDEPSSPGEYNTINSSNGREQISLDFQPIPSDQTPIIQIENASKQKSKRIPNSLSIPGITKSGPKRKNGKMGNDNDHGAVSPTRRMDSLSPTRALSMIDGDPHHALSPSYNISEDAVPFTYSRPGNYQILLISSVPLPETKKINV